MSSAQNFTIDPIHQFEIQTLLPFQMAGYDFSFTNSALAMFVAAFSTLSFFFLALRNPQIIPARLQSVAEMLYNFVHQLVLDIVGSEGVRFFPFIFSIFLFILSCNLLGMFPGAFTATSHLAVTSTLAILSFFFVICAGLYKNGLHFFAIFLPSGLPLLLKPLIIPIEVFSFLIRPFTLALRLCANMTAGHITMKIFASLATMACLSMGVFGALLPFFALIPLNALELFVACVQAYIFTLLVCIYLQSVLVIEH